MGVTRRRLVQSFALGAGANVGAAAEPDLVRDLSGAHSLSDERLRALQPVLERRAAQVRTLRNFEIDDHVAPAHGIL